MGMIDHFYPLKWVSPSAPTTTLHSVVAFLMAFALAATVGTALGFEHIGGFLPCELCLKERVPYYIGAPLMLITGFLSLKRQSGLIIRMLFIITALLMFYDAALSVYHAGAEYGWWLGPQGCSSTSLIVNDAKNMLNSLSGIQPPACDRAAGYFFGLSFAGWNVVATFGFAVVALLCAFISPKKA